MDRRDVPNTDLSVSPICLGTMTFGTPVGEADAIQLVHWAVDHGIDGIDTANMYEGYTRYIGSAGGVAEEILGKALRGRREQVVLATKVGMKIGPNDDDEGLSRGHILREIDRSLKRLRCAVVDLYYMHKPDPKTPLAESVQAFDGLVAAGKVRCWGVSNFSVAEIGEVLSTCDENGWQRPVACQPPYSLLKREVEQDLLPFCRREGIAVFPYQVLQGGLLTGKYRRGQPIPAGSRKAEKDSWIPELSDELLSRLEQIEQDALDKGRTLMEHAIRTVLEHPAVVSLVMGAKRVEQVEQLIAAVDMSNP